MPYQPQRRGRKNMKKATGNSKVGKVAPPGQAAETGKEGKQIKDPSAE